MSLAHLADDVYQGVVPAMLPFLVLERRYSYAAVSGLTLAATVLSSVAQPAFGWWSDRRPRRWLIPAGMTTAAIGVALAAVSTSYAFTWLACALSGLGVAAFHPEAARAARQAAGSSNRAMSVFVLGGNLGFALGPLLATPVLLATGVDGVGVLALPVLAVAGVLALRLNRVLDGSPGRRRTVSAPRGVDDWTAFGWLTAVVITRSVLFFALVTFLALYLVDELGATTAQGATALTTFLFAGATGTVLGGVIADRRGKVIALRVGFALALPAITGLVLATDRIVALAFVALSGVALFVPFSVFVVLGQDYLPHRMGTASGVTVGLAVSAGGLASPLLGVLADRVGLRLVLAMLLPLPALALVLAARLPEPSAGGGAVRGPPREGVG